MLGRTKEIDTKSLIIHATTILSPKKGYIGVGLNGNLRVCNISKGSLYHQFPKGKEELLIACLQSLNEAIMTDIEGIFEQSPTTLEATSAMIDELVVQFETEGMLTGYTFSSIVSEMASLSDRVRNACAHLYEQMQDIYFNKLVADGFLKEIAVQLHC